MNNNNIDSARVVYFSGPLDKSIFVTKGKHLYPNLEDSETFEDWCKRYNIDSFQDWCRIYQVEVPESVEMRYDTDRGIEFYGETITLSGLYLDKETGQLSIDLQGLETIIGQIPLKRMTFINRNGKE